MLVSVLILSGLLGVQELPAATTPAIPSVVSPQATAELTPTNLTPQATPQRPRLICETRALTGRRLESRICYTPEQLAALKEAKRKEAEEIVARGIIQNDALAAGGPPRPGG